MSQKFDDNDWQFYLIMFLILVIILLFVIAVKFFWVRIPDMDTPEGRCEAICAGLYNKVYIGHVRDEEPLTCFCKNPPTPPDKMLLRRP